MAVARVTEIIASSPDGFREAVEEGLARAVRTLRNITGLEVIGKRIKVEHGQIAEYRVEMKVIFLLTEEREGKAMSRAHHVVISVPHSREDAARLSAPRTLRAYRYEVPGERRGGERKTLIAPPSR